MATTLYTPSLDTPSITNSLPLRNSWHNAPSLRCPSPFNWLWMRWNAFKASSCEVHRNTLSVPALSLGLMTHFQSSLLCCCCSSPRKSSTSVTERHSFCVMALSPFARTTSCMRYLFLRASVNSSPLDRVPYRAARRSDSSTPVSAPGRMARMGDPSWSMADSVWAMAKSWLGWLLSCCTIKVGFTLVPFDTSLATGLSISENTRISL
mmetsp:Transcript_9268/g.13859  ORF Transcript_9268/g.13859 Transcript_9268/m.13859 type:complete len:208 (-) Transcript_9268:1825-2448(-)